MGATDKTKQLIRVDLPIELLVKNEENPNKMSSRSFDLLCDNISRTGITDAVLVRPFKMSAIAKAWKQAGQDANKFIETARQQDLKVRIVGGHHRYDAAAYLGFEDVPVTIIMDPNFDEDQEKFQVVRMNAIRGKLDPTAFFNMYQSLSSTYTDDILQDAFGFAEEQEFQRLIKTTAKTLTDPGMKKKKFLEAAKEVETVDGLAKILNELFTKHGDTLPYGYMIFDWNNQRSMWLRTEAKTLKALELIGDICKERRRTVDDVIGKVVQLIAQGDLTEIMEQIVEDTEAVDIPLGMQVAPTLDNLQNIAELEAM